MLFSFRSLRVATTVLALTTLAACSKKNDATPTPTPAVTLGMSWTVDAANASATTTQAQISGNNVAISGTSVGTNMLVYAPKVAGTYQIGSGGATAGYTITAGTPKFYSATSGTIVISTISATNVTGTFTFVGTDSGVSKTITNGTFNANF